MTLRACRSLVPAPPALVLAAVAGCSAAAPGFPRRLRLREPGRGRPGARRGTGRRRTVARRARRRHTRLRHSGPRSVRPRSVRPRHVRWAEGCHRTRPRRAEGWPAGSSCERTGDDRRELRPAGHPELRACPVDVALDGADRDPEPRGDLPVGQRRRGQRGDLPLPPGDGQRPRGRDERGGVRTRARRGQLAQRAKRSPRQLRARPRRPRAVPAPCLRSPARRAAPPARQRCRRG